MRYKCSPGGQGSVFRSNFTISSRQTKNIIQSESFNRSNSNNKSFMVILLLQWDKPNRPRTRRFSTVATFRFGRIYYFGDDEQEWRTRFSVYARRDGPSNSCKRLKSIFHSCLLQLQPISPVLLLNERDRAPIHAVPTPLCNRDTFIFHFHFDHQRYEAHCKESFQV